MDQIVARHDQRLHMYADNCQVYLSTSVEDVSLTVSKFTACIADINTWLSACRLRLNAAKTQLLWLGSSQLLDKVDCRDVMVLGTRVAISDTARDLGVVIDRELSLAAHITAVCCSGYNQLRQLRPVVRSLPMNATKTLVQAFISCRLTTVTHCFMASATDYFNASSQCRTLPLAWSQAPVVVTTSLTVCYLFTFFISLITLRE